MFKGLANLGAMLKQAQQVSSQMQELNAKLKTHRETGTAGGGMVTAEVNGLGELLRVSIEQAIIEKKDRELLEDLIPAAVNQAVAKARQHHAEAMKELTGGMGLPGLDETLSNLTGPGES